jgi:tetratricopeptide (TPR) repeat protein
MTVDALRKLLALDPNDALSRFALGRKLYESSQNLPEAVEHLRFAHRKDPSHLATYLILGRALAATGDRAGAVAVLESGYSRASLVTEGMGRDLAPAMSDLIDQLRRGSVPAHAEIRLAAAAETIDLRHRVLRLGMPRDAAIFPGDDAATTRHAIAIVSGRVACCATIMLEPIDSLPAWRLRGMATDEAHRSLRLGARVLSLLESEASRVVDTGLIWCNARIGAVPFYERAGWSVLTSTPYDIPTAGLHHTMAKRLRPDAPWPATK